MIFESVHLICLVYDFSLVIIHTHNSLKRPAIVSQLPAHIPFQMVSNSSWLVHGFTGMT